MPPAPTAADRDPHLLLLQRIGARQEEIGADIKAMQRDLADARVRFENHEVRLRSLETRPPREPTTDRHDPGRERISIGAALRILVACGVICGSLLGGYAIGQRTDQPPAAAPGGAR